MDYSAPTLAQLITKISEYEELSHKIKNDDMDMDYVIRVMRQMSFIEQYTPTEKQELSRLDFVHRCTPMIRHIVKDAKDPSSLFRIAQSILTRSPSEFKMLVITNNAHLEKAIRRIFKEKIEACTARWDTEIRGFFRASSRAKESVQKRDIEVGKLHDEMQSYLVDLTKRNRVLYELDFSFLKHIADFKQHLIDVANKDMEENPWLKIVDPDILTAIHHSFNHDRAVKKFVWEEPVVISAFRGRLHDAPNKTEFLKRFIVYPLNYSGRYSHLVDSFTGELPALSFDDMAAETASNPESEVVVLGVKGDTLEDIDPRDRSRFADANSAFNHGYASKCSSCLGSDFISTAMGSICTNCATVRPRLLP